MIALGLVVRRRSALIVRLLLLAALATLGWAIVSTFADRLLGLVFTLIAYATLAPVVAPVLIPRGR